jgi:prepilin-type N-terminal cleavage/methylation domain-containing protein
MIHRRGFTLMELLIVMVIVLLVSVLTVPAVVQALAARGIDDAATVLQAAIASARDEAIHANAPRGFRLLPDPAFPATNAAGTGIDPKLPLAANRLLPLTLAPDYSEGRMDIYTLPAHQWVAGQPPDFPLSVGHATYPWWPVRGFDPPYRIPGGRLIQPGVICVAEAPRDADTLIPNPPTSWFWNVRVGDRLRIAEAGPRYTVVGPSTIANSEGFVNDGKTGSSPVLTRTYSDGKTLPVQYLFLVNGVDDDGDGFADNGWDGVDNNLTSGPDDLDEWESEKFPTLFDGPHNHQLAYTISRRPVPASGGREVQLPSSVVIDLTTWGAARERSRLPVDPFTGYVNIMIRPDGSIAYDGPYGVPTRLGLDRSFLHFWLTERADVRAPVATQGRPLTLPVPSSLPGNRRLVTVHGNSGRLTYSTLEDSDPDSPEAPFAAAQQGSP